MQRRFKGVPMTRALLPYNLRPLNAEQIISLCILSVICSYLVIQIATVLVYIASKEKDARMRDIGLKSIAAAVGVILAFLVAR